MSAGAETAARLVAALLLAAAPSLAVTDATSVHAQPRPADGISAIVGGNSPGHDTLVLLLSDVEFEAWLIRLEEDVVRTGPLATVELLAARERLIGRALIVREAARLRVDRVDAPRQAACLDRFFEGHGGVHALEALTARLALVEGELERRVRWECIVRDFSLRSAESGGIVSDAEVEAVYASGEHPFVGVDLEEVRESLRALLVDRRVVAESERWVARLAARVVVARRRLA